MKPPEFVAVSYIATTPEALWAALTRGELTRRYWCDRRIDSDWTVGSAVRFHDGDGEAVSDDGQVLVCEPHRRLVYTFRHLEDPQWRDRPPSRVDFRIEAMPDAGVCKLTLVHDELAAAEDVAAWREGWAPILSTLKSLLESGQSSAPLEAMGQRLIAEHRLKLQG